jgi:hypothetical protein
MDYVELRQIIQNGSYYARRREGETIPQGLSLTSTHAAEYWRYREGDRIYLLCIPIFGKQRFIIEHKDDYVNPD